MRSSDRRRAAGLALRALLCTALCSTVAVTVAASARADRYIGVGGGVAIPYDGKVGWSVNAETGRSMFGSKYLRGSTEFEFRRQEAATSDTSLGYDVPLDEYHLRLMGRFVFAPGGFTPYIGGGGGLSLLHAGATPIVGSEIGLGVGLVALAGIEMPIIGPHVVLYGETRFGYTWDLTGDFSHLTSGGFDGFTGVGGLRFWF
jgi:hypothetical protein